MPDRLVRVFQQGNHAPGVATFSPDGRLIVASAATLEALEDELEAAREDVRQLMFEGVPGPEDDTFLGAEELC